MKKAFLVILISLAFIISPSANGPVVIIGGETIMIDAKYQGVLISGLYDFTINDKHIDVKKNNDVRVNDLIVEIDGKKVSNCDDIYRLLANYQNDTNQIPTIVKRDNQTVSTFITTYYESESQTFKTGFYIKDSINGTGTLTYYNPENNSYGALGHEIIEKTTGEIAEITNGDIFKASVLSINKSFVNEPGEKISQSNGILLGDIKLINQFGMFGHYYGNVTNKPIEIGRKEDVHTGSAKIATVIRGNEVEYFDIIITKVNKQNSAKTKSFEFKVVDQNLLNNTGGIIQGMSGSPIIQDNKLIGAVTHMILQQPENGHGLYIEWMLQQSQQLVKIG